MIQNNQREWLQGPTVAIEDSLAGCLVLCNWFHWEHENPCIGTTDQAVSWVHCDSTTVMRRRRHAVATARQLRWLVCPNIDQLGFGNYSITTHAYQPELTLIHRDNRESLLYAL